GRLDRNDRVLQGVNEGDAHDVIPGSGAAAVSPRRLPQSLLERDGVHQATLGPGGVEPALQLERAGLADNALEDLAVIAGRLERLLHPFVVEPEPRAEIAGYAEQALHGRRARLRHLVDIGLRHAEFLGFDQAVVQPGDDVAPDLVAIAGERTERLLADGDWQHEIIGRIWRRGGNRAGERGSVLGHGIA